MRGKFGLALHSNSQIWSTLPFSRLFKRSFSVEYSTVKMHKWKEHIQKRYENEELQNVLLLVIIFSKYIMFLSKSGGKYVQGNRWLLSSEHVSCCSLNSRLPERKRSVELCKPDWIKLIYMINLLGTAFKKKIISFLSNFCNHNL